MTSQQIQDQINGLEAQVQAGAPQGQIDRMNDQLTVLRRELVTAQENEAHQAEREQEQAEKVGAITLPYDFNELFDNTAANEMVIEVVKEFQTQAYADHNSEIAQLTAEWQEKLRNAATNSGNIVAQLQNQIASHQTQISQLTLEKADAEQKRDNVANELAQANAEIARLNSHIADLQQTIANAPAPKTAIEIGSSERLNELVNKAKESNAEKAARGLARWNATHPEIPIDIPTLNQVPEEPTQDAFRIPSESTQNEPMVHDGEGDTQAEGSEDAEAVIPSTEITLESLHQRLSAVEARLNVKVAA